MTEVLGDGQTPPTLAEFLAAPDEQVAAVMPATVVFLSGGTRRAAALHGVSSSSDDYARFSRERMVSCFQRFFELGVRHLFTCALRYNQFDEVGRYRQRLTDWTQWGLAGPEALADYARLGWRVRVGGVQAIEELRDLNDQLVAATPPQWQHTLWFFATPTRETLWEQMLAAAKAADARNQSELLAALLGEDVPPAGLWIGFGKPIMTADMVPIALVGETDCYWTERPGYEIDEDQIRRILYDAVYRRRTWREDKSRRYDDIDNTRSIWEGRRVIGVGRRAGGFWHADYDQDAPD